MKDCPYCGCKNNVEALRCQSCGTVLAERKVGPEHPGILADQDPAIALAQRKMFFGFLWCAGGTLVTILTYFAAVRGARGGTYVIAWGAIVFGGIEFIQGFRKHRPAQGDEDAAYQLLAQGTQLEVQGRTKEALALYEEVATKYPQSNAGSDARVSMESLQSRLR